MNQSAYSNFPANPSVKVVMGDVLCVPHRIFLSSGGQCVNGGELRGKKQF